MQKLNVLYEDNHVIVVEKMVNVPSQGDKTGDIDMLSIIKSYIKDRYQKPGNVYLGLIHRLDRPVGGIMVFAKTSKAAARLSEQVRSKKMQKEYLAVVNGKITPAQGEWRDYLLKNQGKNKSYVVTEKTKNAKEAILEYTTLKYAEDIDLSVVKIALHTGRHHQIRVQFSSRNHSLYGDQKYGGRGHGKQIALWAYRLTFEHPIHKEMLTFRCLPEKNGTWKILEGTNLEKEEVLEKNEIDSRE